MSSSNPRPDHPHPGELDGFVEAPGPSSGAASGGPLRLLLGIGAFLLLLSVAFGWSTWRAHQEFMEHRHPGDPKAFAWNQRSLSVDECRQEVLAWAQGCSSIQSWCQASVPDLVRECLETQNRRSYCVTVGNEVMSTRFGYQSCRDYIDSVEGKYEKRAAKKYCALSYRAIAGYCEKLVKAPSEDLPATSKASDDARGQL